MDKLENPATLLLEDAHEKHLSLLNKSSLQQLKLSFHQSSNIASNVLLQDVWNFNRKQFDDKAVNVILHSAKSLVQNVETSNNKTWKSSLRTFQDPISLFHNTLPECGTCRTALDYKELENFHDSLCTCDLGIRETNLGKKPANLEKNPLQSCKAKNNQPSGTTKSIFQRNMNTKETESLSQGMKYSEDSTKPKKYSHLVKNLDKEPKRTHTEFKKEESEIETVVLDKEEEENRAHKSNVAKITFKTAKEQLLATNPAAKRTLGASRKAQGKFVSPMISAQEKLEAAETAAISDERLKHLDPKMVELIESEIIDKGTPIGWDDIAGLQLAKSVIQEAVVWPLLRPDIFTGLRRPPKGILLFGPPGTGKTLIGKCVAAQCKATFFSISASSLTSKWIGDGEKMVRALFAVARVHQPAVIFIDEIDSLLTQRSDTEHEATRRIKTEFLVQFDGAATGEEDRLLIVGATNRPQELDEAARRRLVKRLYIPLPDAEARKQIITNLLKSENNVLTEQQVDEVSALTEGYSGADMRSLCSEAAMGPVRAVPFHQITTIHPENVRPVCAQDFLNALQRVRPSVSQDDLGHYVKWNQTYGQGF